MPHVQAKPDEDTGPGRPWCAGLRTPQMLITEFRELIGERAANIRSRVGGRRGMHELRLLAEGLENTRSPVWWAYLAHIGTLDKLETVFTRNGPYETFELLAIARNLLENLIWLKLLRADVDYGLVFYARFLSEQVANTQAYLVKLRGEADLFESMVSLENEIRETTIIALVENTPDPTDDQIASAFSEQRRREAELDDMVRREFSLYSGPATFNGYGYQAFQLRNRIIPDRERELSDMESERDALFLDLPTLLKAKLLALATGKPSQWNWKARADEVHLGKHYDFLYGYTSKLLHSTPLNVITEKALSDSEAMVIFDYIVVATHDLLDEIEAYAPLGQIDAIAITVGENAPPCEE